MSAGRAGPAPRRVVSLVPSLTEAIASGAPDLLVGVTDWCTHPADLAAERIGGTKNPDPARILALAPDLVVANEEENRPADIEALRAAGLTVLVTVIRTLGEAFDELERVLVAGCRLPRPRWWEEARENWHACRPVVDARVVVPIWRRPWMVLGRDTFAGDLLGRLGAHNLLADHAERYPRLPLPALRAAGADLVVLPDEPYAFGPDDGPEAFPELPAALVDGRSLTWYGPSLVEAPRRLGAALLDPLPPAGTGKP
ncbi:helical backbone metal receptor [Streptomyces calidiresistens]|uniref:Cobalamin-binding protein n=1 Tax=Streptomyces calidiresistens TaxID=1485586 RepID=A0A7W3T3F8_9ACTN|nr:helical backbone metal receptor [Streptomyces calidiresistens]MBB0230230.1 cobalamin-binding protein [Streptomyces calidiresistens]